MVPRSGDRGDAVMGDRVVGSWRARTLKLGGGPCDGGGLPPPWILLLSPLSPSSSWTLLGM